MFIARQWAESPNFDPSTLTIGFANSLVDWDQGTIWGPVLCAVATEKVNEMGAKANTEYGTVEIEPMVFVDDICAKEERTGMMK